VVNILESREYGRAVGIELSIKFTKSRVVTVLPTANQMNWSQMDLNSVL